ncbi:MAG TPA: F0F1 ATP synthase subunit A [Gemmatimonadaceae bacterium]|nr:F0F1 ATP synthase subunit A [Gemmatimonadaceae bacterium]
MKLIAILLTTLLAAAPVLAQDTTRAPASPAGNTTAAQAVPPRVHVGGANGEHLVAGQGPNAQPAKVDFITPHISDSHSLEVPFGEIELPRWPPLHVAGMTIDLSPTKHVVMLLIAALLSVLALVPAARAHTRHTRESGAPRGWAAGIEAVVLYLRNEIIIPNVGPHGDRYVPFVLTLFFFILFANLLGLVPYGSTATGNIAVTGMLAIASFVVIEGAGMRTLGWGYWKTIIYWPSDVPVAVRLVITPIMTPVEIFGKFTKPFALAIRLFANMTAGHVVLLALISLIFTFHSYAIAIAPIGMAVANSLLEIVIGFIQAFIFALLTAVFIGLIRQSAH